MRRHQRIALQNVSRAVSITREEVEAWLDTLGFPWTRKAGSAGVYLIQLGPNVAIKLNSSIGSSGSTIGVGTKGSMTMSLVSTAVDRTLNWRLLTAPGNPSKQKVFRRVENWRTNWSAPVAEYVQEYRGKQAFYDRIALERGGAAERPPAQEPDEEEETPRAIPPVALTRPAWQIEAERAQQRMTPQAPPLPPAAPPLPVAAQSDDPRLVALRVAFLVARKDLGPIDPVRAKKYIELFTRTANDYVKTAVAVSDDLAKQTREAVLNLGVPFVFPTDAEWKTHQRRSGSATNGRRALRNSARRREPAPRGFPF